ACSLLLAASLKVLQFCNQENKLPVCQSPGCDSKGTCSPRLGRCTGFPRGVVRLTRGAGGSPCTVAQLLCCRISGPLDLVTGETVHMRTEESEKSFKSNSRSMEDEEDDENLPADIYSFCSTAKPQL
ncbi:hypothetical protein KIL84_006558, partial [Mauremys mutica]